MPCANAGDLQNDVESSLPILELWQLARLQTKMQMALSSPLEQGSYGRV